MASNVYVLDNTVDGTFAAEVPPSVRCAVAAPLCCAVHVHVLRAPLLAWLECLKQ